MTLKNIVVQFYYYLQIVQDIVHENVKLIILINVFWILNECPLTINHIVRRRKRDQKMSKNQMKIKHTTNTFFNILLQVLVPCRIFFCLFTK